MSAHESHEEVDYDCPECEAEVTASAVRAGTGGTSYTKAELREGFDLKREIRLQRAAGGFDLKREIRLQRAAGAAVIAPLSMLRCSECGDLLDAYGCCTRHGLIDTEALDGYE